MSKYEDIELYPNGYNACDGMKLDWWNVEENRGCTFAGFVETQVTPNVTDIEDIHGNYIGRISHPESEQDYLEQLVGLVEAFTA